MKKLTLTLSMLMLTMAVAFAQQGQVDEELKALIRKSFGYFPRIKELEQQVEISNLREDVNRAGYRPQVTGNATFSYLNPISIIQIPTGPGTFNEIKTQPYNNQNANIGVNQVLYDFGRMRHSIEKTKYDILIAANNLESNKITLASQVAGVYFSIIYLENSLRVQDSVLSYFRQYKRLIDNKIKRGDALEFDALSAQSNIDQADNRKVDLENQLQRQINLLTYTTGEIIGRTSTDKLLTFPIGALSEDSLMSIARQHNVDIMLSRNRILQQEEDVALNHRNFMPVFTVNGAVGFKNGYQPDIFQTRFNYLVGAGLSIPIYTGNRNRDQLKISEKSLAAARYAAVGTEIGVKRDIEQALADVQASTDRLANMESQIAQATRALDLANSRFKNGTITYVELLNAQTNLQTAHLFRLQYAYQLTLAKVELARLLGYVYW